MENVPALSPSRPRSVPESDGMGNPISDDFASRLSAYQDVEEGALPALWTPEQVQVRLIESMVVVSKTAGRIGPKEHGTAWPAILLEFKDFVGYEHVQYMKDRRAEIQRQAERSFTSLELSRADEAINWASRYLADEPTLADAIQLWAWCKARHLKIEKVLRGRCLAADRLRSVRAAEADAARQKAMDARRREIAAEYARWANERVVEAPDAAYAARIRSGARELARKAVLEAERAMPRPSTKLKRSDVMHGKVFTNQYLDVQRKKAALALAEALHRDGVAVR